MQSLFIDYIILILFIVGLIMLATRLRVAYPIVLVLGGLALSFTNEFAQITIGPEVVFLVFLPPLLYEAAWQVSWKEFWRWRRIIISFAFPIVIFTSCAIALISQALIPGFTLALGFVLGGIVSPPDAISTTTIMRQADVPRAMVSFAEGESLLNDASSLIVFRFALAAVLTGQFHAGQAATSFFLVVLLGIGIGLLVGLIFYGIHRWLPTTPSIDIVLTLVTPYCMYYAAEHFHYSGVLAVVSGGLFLSARRQRILSYKSRIQGINVWANLVFVLNGLVFLLIGLQLPVIARQLGPTSLSNAILYGLIISLALTVIRLFSTFGAVLFTRFISRFITVADANPEWKGPLILGWAGMRGVVSLASALSVPLLTDNGQSFPYRNLILFITFIVILVTLVVQGLTLPWLIRKIHPADRYRTMSNADQERLIQQTLAKSSLAFLDTKLEQNKAVNVYLDNLHQRFTIDLDQSRQADWQANYEQTYLEILQRQRDSLNVLNQQAGLDEELIRKYITLVDIDEFKLREKRIFEDNTIDTD